MLLSITANHTIPVFNILFPPTSLNIIVNYSCGGSICDVTSCLIPWPRLYIQHKLLICVLAAFKGSDQVQGLLMLDAA